jgi:hypothetical protein
LRRASENKQAREQSRPAMGWSGGLFRVNTWERVRFRTTLALPIFFEAGIFKQIAV